MSHSGEENSRSGLSMAGRGQQPGSPAAWSSQSMDTCSNGCKICWWLAGRQNSAAVRWLVQPPPLVFLPLLPTQSSLQHPLQEEACAALGRAVLAEWLHLKRALDRRGPPSGAAPRALIRADVEWVWALGEGPGEDEEGARCAAGALRPERALSPGAADQWTSRARGAGAWSRGAARGRTRAPLPLGAGWGRRGGPAGMSACGNFRVAVGCWVVREQGARAAFGGAFVPGGWRVGSRFVPGGPSAWEPQRATGVSASAFIEPAPGFGYSSGGAPRELPCCFENWVSKYSLRS